MEASLEARATQDRRSWSDVPPPLVSRSRACLEVAISMTRMARRRGHPMGLWNSGLEVRARRALDRQLEYQRRKAAQLKGREQEVISWMGAHSQEVRRMLDDVRPIPSDTRVLEVGCGAHGLIFFFGVKNGIGLDPLAQHYAKLFPAWQRRALTISATGESLPLRDESFDIVLCDN